MKNEKNKYFEKEMKKQNGSNPKTKREVILKKGTLHKGGRNEN